MTASVAPSRPAGLDVAPVVDAVEAARRADVAIELARRALLGRGDVAALREVLAVVVDVLADGVVVPEGAGPVVEVDGTVVPWAGEGPAPASSRVAAYLRRVGVGGV